MIRLISTHYKILLFGLFSAFFTAPGQTFLISLFIPHFRDLIGTNQAGISMLYSFATLMSALALPVLGNLLDKVHLKTFTIIIAIGLICGCLVLSSAQSAISVFIGFFLIRNMGQGTLGMISSTTMARVFSHSRGKALGIANLGYPLSEAFFPFLIMSIVHWSQWRIAWVCLAGIVATIYIPSIFILLSTYDADEKKSHDEQCEVEGKISQALHQVISIKPAQIIRDINFYFLIPAALIYACFLTALFFHQMTIIQQRGWDIQFIPGAFIVYGLFRAPASFFAGPMIDKIGAKKIFPYTILPMICGLVVFLYGNNNQFLFMYMAFLGAGAGFSMTVMGALWAELYGTEYLGAIKPRLCIRNLIMLQVIGV